MNLNKKVNLNINRFRFKWWSWDVDISRFALLLFIILSLLPVLPYKREDGELKVLGIPASVDNFYDLGIKATKLNFNYTDYKFKKGTIGYELTQIYNMLLPNFLAYKKYLLSKGISEDKANCIFRRDIMYTFSMQYAEVSRILSQYPPSPVPAIWMYRSFQSNILSSFLQPSARSFRYSFNKVSESCDTFKFLAPSTDLLEKFKY